MITEHRSLEEAQPEQEAMGFYARSSRDAPESWRLFLAPAVDIALPA